MTMEIRELMYELEKLKRQEDRIRRRILKELEEEGKRIFTIKEIAEILETREDTIRKWVKQGKLVGGARPGHLMVEIKGLNLKDFLEEYWKRAV